MRFFGVMMIWGMLSLYSAEFDLKLNLASKLESKQQIVKAMDSAEVFTYKKTKEKDLQLFLFRPKGLKEGEIRPAVLFIHGGGWVSGYEKLFAAQAYYLASRGIVCASINYRLISKKAGGTPADCLEDAKSAMRFFKKNAAKFNVDPTKIMSAGGSAGGHLALSLLVIDGYDAKTDDLEISPKPTGGVILFNPAFDLVDGWGGGRYQVKKAQMDVKSFSPAHHMFQSMPPILILSGEKDKIVPSALIRNYQNRMKELGNSVKFVEYPGAEHAWFNWGKTLDNRSFIETMTEVDKFLISLGYLQGKPTLPAVK